MKNQKPIKKICSKKTHKRKLEAAKLVWRIKKYSKLTRLSKLVLHNALLVSKKELNQLAACVEKYSHNSVTLFPNLARKDKAKTKIRENERISENNILRFCKSWDINRNVIVKYKTCQ